MGSSVGGDAGIDTDEGFEINGGTVIALGTDMLEKPEKMLNNNYKESSLLIITFFCVIILKDKLQVVAKIGDERN